MGTDMLDAMVHQHADGLFRAVLDVVVGCDCLALGPALDAFEQGAAHVPARLAGCQRGVQVDVRLDERRHYQVLPGIQAIGSAHRHPFGLGHDGGDAFAVEFDAKQAGPAAQACVDDVHDASPWALRVAPTSIVAQALWYLLLALSPAQAANQAPSNPICQKSASRLDAWPKIPTSSANRCSVMLRAASSSRCLRAAVATPW